MWARWKNHNKVIKLRFFTCYHHHHSSDSIKVFLSLFAVFFCFRSLRKNFLGRMFRAFETCEFLLMVFPSPLGTQQHLAAHSSSLRRRSVGRSVSVEWDELDQGHSSVRRPRGNQINLFYCPSWEIFQPIMRFSSHKFLPKVEDDDEGDDAIHSMIIVRKVLEHPQRS